MKFKGINIHHDLPTHRTLKANNNETFKNTRKSFTLISTTEPVAGAEIFRLSTTGPLWIGTDWLWDPRCTTGSLDD